MFRSTDFEDISRRLLFRLFELECIGFIKCLGASFVRIVALGIGFTGFGSTGFGAIGLFSESSLP